jgi:hypothetical protein
MKIFLIEELEEQLFIKSAVLLSSNSKAGFPL